MIIFFPPSLSTPSACGKIRAKGDESMLTPDQESFLRWISSQPAPVSKKEIESADAPGYSFMRLNYLVKEGYVFRKTDLLQNGDFLTGHSIGERGIEALQQLDDMRRKDAEQKSQQRFENKVSIANILVPALTFVLGMLTEHLSNITGVIVSLFFGG